MPLIFNIPTSFTQGDRLSWFEHFPDYNFLTDTLSCFIRGQRGAVDLTAVGSVDGWEFSLSEDRCSQLATGVYQAQFVMLSGSGRKTLGIAKIEVKGSYESLTTLDPRSDDEKELEVITAAIARLVSGAVAEYRIGDRMMRYQDLAELTSRQEYLRKRIRYARRQVGIGGRNIGISFSSS